MITYREFRPTAFDAPGAFIHDEQRDWFVAPVMRTRDSDRAKRATFARVEKRIGAMDETGETWSIHRFGHWGPGWFEIILVKPGTRACAVAERIERKRSDE